MDESHRWAEEATKPYRDYIVKRDGIDLDAGPDIEMSEDEQVARGLLIEHGDKIPKSYARLPLAELAKLVFESGDRD